MDEFENSPSAVPKNFSSLQITPLIQNSEKSVAIFKKLTTSPQIFGLSN